jgi:mannitol-1-/sugar-/sorbitol-6-phosphatase
LNFSPGPISCRAILFDLDGVLVDSQEAFHRQWLAWAAQHGVDGEATFQLGQGLLTADHIRIVAPHLNADLEAERFDEAAVDDVDGVRAISGARTLVEGLPKGAWAVVTSSIERLARSRLRAAGLPEPAVLITPEVVTRGKPDPEGYIRAAQLLGVSPAASVVIEDSPTGIRAGRAAGAFVIAIPTTHPREELLDASVIAALTDIQARSRHDRGLIELTFIR